MALDVCIFAVSVRSERARALTSARVGSLGSFYEALRAPSVRSRYLAEHRVLLGAIDLGGSGRTLDGPLVFGAPLPPHLSTAPALVSAPDEALRALDLPLAAIAAGADAVHVITGAGAPTVLYEASGQDVHAFSTHAIAASFLATGEARIDETVVPELLAAQFVGGERSLIRGVRPLQSASRIRLTASGPAYGSYWPMSDRWERLPPEQAQAHAERHFLASLERRLANVARPCLGLTEGLDSRVVAVALRELGIDQTAFTWGESNWPDVVAATRVAAALGIKHRFQPFDLFSDEHAVDQVGRDVRWTEGSSPIGFGGPTWPPGISAFLTGGGGEAGRAFYYRFSTLNYRRPNSRQLAQVLSNALGASLPGASRAALADLKKSAAGWVAHAEQVGQRGWQTLDIVYVEQRMHHWGRTMLPRGPLFMIPAFDTPEVLRALSSLPLRARLSEGFHRAFLAAHAPVLAPAVPPQPQRSGVPAPLRRAAARLRARSRSRSRPTPVLADEWKRRPHFERWISDEVLSSPLLVASLGESWCNRTRRLFLSGDGPATEMALRAGGPVALREALRELS